MPKLFKISSKSERLVNPNSKSITKSKSKAKGIFRRKSSSKDDQVQKTLTWTLSEDSACVDDFMKTEISTSDISKSVSQAFEQFNATPLVEDAIQMVEEREKEIDSLRENQFKEITESHRKEIISLKETHRQAIEDKVRDICHLIDLQKENEAKHAKTVKVYEHVMLSQEEELLGLKDEIQTVKNELAATSSVLIQTQHDLHEMSESWPVQLFGILNNNEE